MARYRLRRYMGIVFIGVVIAPAVVLSFLAIRAISHEEAYIEKQIEGTLAAEVAHVSSMVTAELARIQAELDATAVIPVRDDPSQPFARWMRSSSLVGIPFLLSPDYEIVWPVAESGRAKKRQVATAAEAPRAGEAEEQETGFDAESAFLLEQKAFLTDEEKTPVYENIAVAHKDEILEEEEGAVTAFVGAARETMEDRDRGRQAEAEVPVDASWVPAEVGTGKRRVEHLKADRASKGGAAGEETRKQTAISRFLQSPSVREKVYDKAELEGQKVLYRNVEVADAEREAAIQSDAATEPEPTTEPEPASAETTRPEPAGIGEDLEREAAEPKATQGEAEAPVSARPSTPVESGIVEDLKPDAAGRIRSIFISEPLSFSEIVAGARSGIIPRMMDGRLELLYWQRTAGGEIFGCLIDPVEFRERIIGTLPGVYSAVRILTVLDEDGSPLIVPPGHGGRDWRRPFVAREISEILPRWEIAAYLTDPDVISSRAQVATSVMWILILILFVSIAAGGLLIVRSTYAEMRLAQQKTTFVANVSHELKTPLTSIRMFAEMLRDGHQRDKEKQRKYLDIVAGETERLTRLVNNVLDFSRMERGEKRYTMKTVDLVSLCSEVVESQRTRFENDGFKVALTTHTGTLRIRADEEAIKQALINLLSNAEKYSTERKEIEVEVRREDRSALIGVSDRGIGIGAGDAERIFDEFYRVDEKLTSRVKGAGLGLTIARQILRDHSGDIRYRAREGGGSVFELMLPLTEEGKE